MATTTVNSIRTADDHHSRTGLALATYVALVIGTVAIATGAAVFLASLTSGLGQFVLLAGGWLALVSAAPTVAERGAARILARSRNLRAPRSNRAVRAVVTAFSTR
ncbi:MAG: hypothetical protein ABEH59_10250 [Halobacteriales archaeon]